MKKYLLVALLALLLLPVRAQEVEQSDKPTATQKGWFVGVQGGVPFGVSTFSSFGADKTRPGFSAGLYGGYRFNPVLSLEATAKWGKDFFASQACCVDHNYWLGEDGIRYNAPVLDMNGWDYSNLKSVSFMQHYGLQLNVNILGFFDKTKDGRWTLELSPLVAAVGSKATLKTIDSNTEVMKDDTRWHVGVGGNLQAGYQVARHVNIGIYSGVTYYTCDRIDGAPVDLHKANYAWESGVKVGFTFGKKAKKVAPVVVPPVIEEPQPEPEVTVCPKTTEPDTIIMPESQPIVEEAEVVLPNVYFAFNSTTIADDELSKLEEIKAQMEANPEMKITVNGWCDKYGSKAVNDRISLQRAEAVKSWLVNNGIAAERIVVKGNSKDLNEPDAAKARRVESVTIITE